MKSILVTYATKHGATLQIAQAITNTLRKHHLEVHLIPVGAVKSLDNYDAVVLGSAVYIGDWLDDALAFLKRFDVELQKLPVYLFSSGPTGEGDAEELLKGWQYPEGIEAYVKRILPVEIMVFHGRLALDKLPFWQRWMIKAMNAPLGDYRHWDEIQAWAENIAQAFSHEIEAV